MLSERILTRADCAWVIAERKVKKRAIENFIMSGKINGTVNYNLANIL